MLMNFQNLNMPIRIMFICHGNICRSPMAEFILKDMVAKAGQADEFVIASSATSTEEIWNGAGNPVYPPARAELERHGIFCSGKRAVQLQKGDYSKYDLFLCMDHANLRNALCILGSDPEGKVKMLLPNRDVSDPWYTERFDVAYRDMEEGCRLLFAEITHK